MEEERTCQNSSLSEAIPAAEKRLWRKPYRKSSSIWKEKVLTKEDSLTDTVELIYREVMHEEGSL